MSVLPPVVLIATHNEPLARLCCSALERGNFPRTVEVASGWRAAAVQAASHPSNPVLLEGGLFMERPQGQARYPLRARQVLFAAAMLCTTLAWGSGSQEDQHE